MRVKFVYDTPDGQFAYETCGREYFMDMLKHEKKAVDEYMADNALYQAAEGDLEEQVEILLDTDFIHEYWDDAKGFYEHLANDERRGIV